MKYNKIIGIFEQACSDHLGINSFSTGPLSFLDSNSENIKYPFVFLRPMTSPGVQTIGTTGTSTRTLSFELYVLDNVKLSNESPVDIISRLEVVLNDINSYFVNGTYQQDLDYTCINITPVNEAFNDRVYGWLANISIRTPYQLSICKAPF